MANLKELLASLQKALREQLLKLSRREKVLVICAISIFVTMVGYAIYNPVQEAFSSQTVRFTEASQQLQNVAAALSRYQKLKVRREAIEREFKEIEIEEGALSYLEELVKREAGVLNPQINPREIREFGADYEQAPFSIRFPIVDLARLVKFLEELVYGKKPFILATLEVKRRPAGDSLDVELEVSSIRHKKTS